MARVSSRFLSRTPKKIQDKLGGQRLDWGLSKDDSVPEETVEGYTSIENRYLSNKLCGRSPFLWKTIGDEIIFWKELGHEHQLWLLINSWMASIAEIRGDLNKVGLDVKSTIWLAEFPVRNATILREAVPTKMATNELVAGVDDLLPSEAARQEKQIRDQKRSEFYKDPRDASHQTDFIGPGIDLGFRLSSLASSKRMMISLDIAYLLALSWTTANNQSFTPSLGIASLGEDGIAPPTPDFGQECRDGSVEIKEKLEELTFHKDLFVDGDLFNIRLNFSGSQALKGVLGGAKYPKFWINTVPDKSLQAQKDTMYIKKAERGSKPKRPGVEWDNVLNYCLAFYEDRRSYLSPPVILPEKRDVPLVTLNGKEVEEENWSATYQYSWCEEYKTNVNTVQGFGSASPDDAIQGNREPERS